METRWKLQLGPRRRPGRMTVLLVAMTAALAVAACGDDDDNSGTQGPYDLSFNSDDFAPHEGQTVYVAVVDEAAGTVVATDSQVVAGGFWFLFEGVLEHGKAYRVDYFADVDGDGACSPPPQDHVWQVPIDPVTDNVTLYESHSTNFAAAGCDSF